MKPADREGTFRAEITSYRLVEFESGSVGVEVKAKLLEMYDEGNKAWVPWEEYQFEAEGVLFIVKKDGKPNDIGAKSLVYAGWDCSIVSLRENLWQPTRCQLLVKGDNFRDQLRYRIDSLSGWDRTPGGSTMSAEKASELSARYDSQFRAIAGSIRTNAAPPAPGRPAPPPPRPSNGNGPRPGDGPAYNPPPPPPNRQPEDVPF